MATKKSEEKSNEVEDDPRGQVSAVEERRRRKEEATTVDGSESPSVNPPGDPAEGAKKRGGIAFGKT